jgi:hypothetical protein
MTISVESVLEFLRTAGGVIGVLSLIGSFIVFYVTRGKVNANQQLLEENNSGLKEQNDLLRNDIKDRQERSDRQLDLLKEEAIKAERAHRDQVSELLDKLSTSIQDRIAQGQRIAVLEAIVTQAAPIADFRKFMEEAIEHFQGAAMEGSQDHAAMIEALKTISGKGDQTVETLEKVGKALDSIVDYLRGHNGDSLKNVEPTAAEGGGS